MTKGLKKWSTDNGEYRGHTYRGYYIVKSDGAGWDVNLMGEDGFFRYQFGRDTLTEVTCKIDRILEDN
jgi:hypothetical protein